MNFTTTCQLLIGIQVNNSSVEWVHNLFGIHHHAVRRVKDHITDFTGIVTVTISILWLQAHFENILTWHSQHKHMWTPQRNLRHYVVEDQKIKVPRHNKIAWTGEDSRRLPSSTPHMIMALDLVEDWQLDVLTMMDVYEIRMSRWAVLRLLACLILHQTYFHLRCSTVCTQINLKN
jgi:hypothetical protein